MEIGCGGNAVGSERMSRESASVFTWEGGRQVVDGKSGSSIPY